MSLSIAFRRQARREFDEAVDWYEQRSVGLGAKFIVAVERVLKQAIEKTQAAMPWFLKACERGLCKDFPIAFTFGKREERL